MTLLEDGPPWPVQSRILINTPLVYVRCASTSALPGKR